jgi:hypothetical protein
MKKLLSLIALVLCLSCAALAQDAAKTKKPTEPKTSQLTGCVTGPNAEGAYMLTNGHYKKGVEIGGNDELKNHVGHQVRMTGTWSDAKSIGVTEQAEKTAAKSGSNTAGQRKFKVATLNVLADTCPAAGSAAAAGKTKAGKTKGEAPKQ